MKGFRHPAVCSGGLGVCPRAAEVLNQGVGGGEEAHSQQPQLQSRLGAAGTVTPLASSPFHTAAVNLP